MSILGVVLALVSIGISVVGIRRCRRNTWPSREWQSGHRLTGVGMVLATAALLLSTIGAAT